MLRKSMPRVVNLHRDKAGTKKGVSDDSKNPDFQLCLVKNIYSSINCHEPVINLRRNLAKSCEREKT